MIVKILFLYVLSFFFALPILAKELKVGIGISNYPPYYFVQDGELKGPVIEITRHIVKELGHTLVFQAYPWPRVQSNLRLGGIDMVMMYFKTVQREQYAIYTDTPHIHDASYLFVNKHSKIEFYGSINSVKNYRFGNVRGYSHGTEYDSASQITKSVAVDSNQLIRMLLKGRIDIGVGNKAVVSSHAKEKGVLDKIDFLSPAIEAEPAYFAFSKVKTDSKQLAEQFSIEIKKFIKTEKYHDILTAYGLTK